MQPNPDYLSQSDIEKIEKIKEKENLFLYQIGQMCEIKDKAFWSRIMQNKKPIPVHARDALERLFNEKGAKNDKKTEICE